MRTALSPFESSGLGFLETCEASNVFMFKVTVHWCVTFREQSKKQESKQTGKVLVAVVGQVEGQIKIRYQCSENDSED